jgi:hypothetical protein
MTAYTIHHLKMTASFSKNINCCVWSFYITNKDVDPDIYPPMFQESNNSAVELPVEILREMWNQLISKGAVACKPQDIAYIVDVITNPDGTVTMKHSPLDNTTAVRIAWEKNIGKPFKKATV